MQRYSQNSEQDIILTHFNGRIGTFLDLGAFDGIRLSNVRALAELGWSGVMVEPSPGVFIKLKENYKDFPLIELYECAVGDVTAELPFQNNENAVGSFHKHETKRWEGVETFDEIPVQCIEINELIAKSKYKQFDFISIDCEGVDYDIAIRLNYDTLGTKMVCIEFNGVDQARYDAIFLKFGFKLLHKNAENLIYAR